jgi:hypothetical protein
MLFGESLEVLEFFRSISENGMCLGGCATRSEEARKFVGHWRYSQSPCFEYAHLIG